jgi:hypothetical protein
VAVTLKEEHSLKVFENRVLRTICTTKREDVRRGRGKLRKEVLHGFCCASNIIPIK